MKQCYLCHKNLPKKNTMGSHGKCIKAVKKELSELKRQKRRYREVLIIGRLRDVGIRLGYKGYKSSVSIPPRVVKDDIITPS